MADNFSRSKGLIQGPKVNRVVELIAHRQYYRNKVFDTIRWIDVKLEVTGPGIQTLQICMVDTDVVIDKIVVNSDNNYLSSFWAPIV